MQVTTGSQVASFDKQGHGAGYGAHKLAVTVLVQHQSSAAAAWLKALYSDRLFFSPFHCQITYKIDLI